MGWPSEAAWPQGGVADAAACSSSRSRRTAAVAVGATSAVLDHTVVSVGPYMFHSCTWRCV